MPEAVQALTPIPTTRDHWSRAFHQWLTARRAQNTRRAYERAWKDLLTYTGKDPWAIGADDIRDWIADLQTRPLNRSVAKGLIKKRRRTETSGYAASTINLYLAGISSFYTFAREKYFINPPGAPDQPLHGGINPVRAVDRPKVTRFGKSDYLTINDLTVLLRAIKPNSILGLRDMALILGFILTGRRNSEWRALRWGDLVQRGDKVYYNWAGKGKEDQTHQLPPPVWDVLETYLLASGRLPSIHDDDYIFTPLNRSAIRLQNVSAESWNKNRPLSLGHCNTILKKYARRAGLDPTRLSVHTLRHSFAMLLSELGADALTISRRLAHSSLDMTLTYLDHLKGVEDNTWRQAAAALKLDLL